MNLAIHDLLLLRRLFEAGETRSWQARGIAPWMISGQVVSRPYVLLLEESVPLKRQNIRPEEMGFFDIFKEHHRRLTHREAELLFLAKHTGSVLLTGEHMVAEAARGIGLHVCFDSAALDLYYPLPVVSNSIQISLASAEALPVAAIVESLREHFAPSANPSARRVPDPDEPVEATPILSARRSSGSDERSFRCNRSLP